MSQTTPFQVVTSAALQQKQPFEHLYTHVKQRDPKLFETISRLAQPTNLNATLANPLQAVQIWMQNPMMNDVTNWPPILSNDPTDQTNYFPLVAWGSVRVVSSTDIMVDVEISHDKGTTFTSVFNSPFVIPAGQHVATLETISFAPGTYLRNQDLVQGKFLSTTFNGMDITVVLLFQ